MMALTGFHTWNYSLVSLQSNPAFSFLTQSNTFSLIFCMAVALFAIVIGIYHVYIVATYNDKDDD